MHLKWITLKKVLKTEFLDNFKNFRCIFDEVVVTAVIIKLWPFLIKPQLKVKFHDQVINY